MANPLNSGWTTGGLMVSGTADDDIFTINTTSQQWAELVGDSGDDILIGDAGADVFAFIAGGDSITITDFDPGVDRLAIAGLRSGFTVKDLLPFVSQDGDDVVIAAGGQEIRFEDTQLSDLSAGDVFFV